MDGCYVQMENIQMKKLCNHRLVQDIISREEPRKSTSIVVILLQTALVHLIRSNIYGVE